MPGRKGYRLLAETKSVYELGSKLIFTIKFVTWSEFKETAAPVAEVAELAISVTLPLNFRSK